MAEKKSKYGPKYKPEFCDQLIEHMSEGYSIESFAGKIGVGRQSLYNWFKNNEDFSEAKEIGVMKSLFFWEKLGKDGMWMTKEGPNLNPTIWIANMNNRFGWSGKNKEVKEETKAAFTEAVKTMADELIKQWETK
jgi:hypothetical protein